MIELKNVSSIYPSKKGPVIALNNVNLHIKPGEIYGLIGKSGAGKSTLLRCVNLIEKPTQGEVVIDGCNMQNLSQKALRRKRYEIGMIFQNFGLLSAKTVYNNIALPFAFAHKKPDHTRIDELLDLIGLKDKSDVYPEQLSGGQKQRVAIARALALQPKILLCDEATSALDPQTTRSILQLLKKVNSVYGITILLITHEMEVIKHICHRVGVIEEGSIVEEGNLESVFINPISQTAKALLRENLHAKLPEEVVAHLYGKQQPHMYPIVRLFFSGEETKKPLIAALIERFQLKINILQANIDLIGKEIIGVLLVEIMGDREKCQQAYAFFNTSGIRMEIVTEGREI